LEAELKALEERFFGEIGVEEGQIMTSLTGMQAEEDQMANLELGPLSIVVNMLSP